MTECPRNMYGSWKITGRDCQYVLVMNVQETRYENELEHYIFISPEKKPYNEDTEKETHTQVHSFGELTHLKLFRKNLYMGQEFTFAHETSN